MVISDISGYAALAVTAEIAPACGSLAGSTGNLGVGFACIGGTTATTYVATNLALSGVAENLNNGIDISLSSGDNAVHLPGVIDLYGYMFDRIGK